MRGSVLAIVWLILGASTAPLAAAARPAPADSAAEEPSGSEAAASATSPALVDCDVMERARSVRDSSRVLAKHLRDGYAESYPSAVTLASSLVRISASLEAQLRAVEPTHRAFREAWSAYDSTIRRSPLPSDPRFAPVLPSYLQGVEELDTQLGCEAPADTPGMIPCPAILTAHLLADVGADIHRYIHEKYGDDLAEQLEAGGELAAAARALHQVLHDLEIAVPGTRGAFEALEAGLHGSALTDTNDPEDREVKSRLAAVAEAVAALEGSVGSCHVPLEGHEGH